MLFRSAELSWAIIRTLHEIAQTPQTLTLLKSFFATTQNATLKMACLSASQIITERLNYREPLSTTLPSYPATTITV